MSTTFKPTFKVNNVVFSPSLKGESPSPFGGASGAGVKWEHILGKPSVFPPAEHSHPEYAPLLSPEFTGEPTAPTPEEGDDSNRIATTAFVLSALESAEEVFIAVYGVTSYEEITAALASGKAVFAHHVGEEIILPYTCTPTSNSSYVFSGQIGWNYQVFYCATDSTWTWGTQEIAPKSSVPSRTSQLTNDSGFIAESALDGMASKGWVEEQGYITEVGTLYHPQLEARGDPDQHPIEAITSLEGELAARPSEVMSNSDILNILSR